MIIIQYCDECENILLPVKNKASVLVCRTCGKTFTKEADQNSMKNEYKISRKKKITVKSKEVFVKKEIRSITDEDRRAFEDLTYND